MHRWTPSMTATIRRVKRLGSVYYSRALPKTTEQLLDDGYMKPTKFGFGNYCLTDLGGKKFIELNKD